MAFWQRREASLPVEARLRRRVGDYVDRHSAGAALEGQALADTSQALDAILLQRRRGAALPIGVLADVIVVHRLRTTELASAQDAHAYVALAVWMHTANGGMSHPSYAERSMKPSRAAPRRTSRPLCCAPCKAMPQPFAHWLKTQDPALADTVVAVSCGVPTTRRTILPTPCGCSTLPASPRRAVVHAVYGWVRPG